VSDQVNHNEGVPRIEKLRVRNFRALRDLELRDITPLTVLVGPNGSGKSTFLRGILRMKQVLEGGPETIKGHAGLWHCSYLIPGTTALLIYELEWEKDGANLKEAIRWLNLAKDDVLALDAGRKLKLWDLDLPADVFDLFADLQFIVAVDAAEKSLIRVVPEERRRSGKHDQDHGEHPPSRYAHVRLLLCGKGRAECPPLR